MNELTEDFETLIVAWLKSSDENAAILAHSLAKQVRNAFSIQFISKRYIVAKEEEGIFEQLCCCVYDDLEKAQDFVDAMADTLEHWDSKIVILNVC